MTLGFLEAFLSDRNAGCIPPQLAGCSASIPSLMEEMLCHSP
jgi:hypothetical protein